MKRRNHYMAKALLQNFRGRSSGGSLEGHFLDGMLRVLSFEGISLDFNPPLYPPDAEQQDLVRIGEDMYREIGKINAELASRRASNA